MRTYLSGHCGVLLACKPAVDPVDRWGLCCESAAEDSATEVVGEKNVACLAVEADKVVMSGGVTALLDHEPKVD